MKYLAPLIVALCLFLTLKPTVFALDLEIGYKRLMPKLGIKEQEYEKDTGEKNMIKPEVESTAVGQSFTLGIRFESISFHLENSEYTYDSHISADNAAVTEATEIECKTSENRFSINYNLERDLAGIYAGIGVSNSEEVLKSNSNEWVSKATSPLIKVGINLILDSWRLQYEQIYLSLKKHSIRVDSIGILFYF
ncbi:hypothetical protein KKA14_20450 [bacterium]|nr:hypothetical protein [bacterium]